MDRNSNEFCLVNTQMKFLSKFTIAALLLAGCATPLKQDAASPDVGRILGVSSSDVRFVSYCSFGDAPPSGHHVSFDQGIIAITRDSLVLLKGDLAKASVAHRL